MSKQSLQACYSILNYTFQKPALLEIALSHRSYSSTHNERLEFLGDSLLNFIIAEALYTQHPNATEGELSRLRSKLVQGETLAEIAKALNLGQFLKLGHGELKSGGAERISTLADVVEAIIAAIFLDSSMETCKTFVLQLFDDRLKKTALMSNTKDPKTQLQEYLQERKSSLPLYEVVSTEGEHHQQTFTVSCTVFLSKNSKKTLLGISSNRRKAEQIAAQQFLDWLESIK